MHSPAFFFSLVAISAAVFKTQAFPIITSDVSPIPDFYQPPSITGPTAGAPGALARRSTPMTTSEATTIAENHIMAAMGMEPADMQMTNAYTSVENGITHFYATQMLNDTPIVNAVSNVNVDAQGNVMSFHQSFAPTDMVAKAVAAQRRDSIAADQAVLMFAQSMGLPTTDKLTVIPAEKQSMVVMGASFAQQPIQVTTKFYQTSTAVIPVYDMNIQMNDMWVNAFVNSATGDIAGISNWTSDVDKRHVVASITAAKIAKAKAAKASPAQGSLNVPAANVTGNGGNSVPAAAAVKNKVALSAGSPVVGAAPATATMPTVGAAAAPVTGAAAAGAAQNKAVVPAAAPAAPVAGAGVGANGIAPATYSIIPMGKVDPTQGFQVVTSPWNLQASPAGWHNPATTDLSGNNVIAQSNANNVQSAAALAKLTRPVSAQQNFQFKFDPAQGPTLAANRDAATTNAFYVANSMHDIFYNYGFTEAAGNFQQNNNGKGGVGNDGVLANTQDGSGVNNANFASPPDGQPGIMRMFVFNTATPNRDGALENDVVEHEMTHGLSNRLTGGPANANCLQTLESGGMGEGWSDTFAMLVSLPDANTATTDFITGAYVTNSAKGVRNFPYSTSTTTNPLMFSSLNKLNEVHNIGEVWCNMLFQVMWNMIAVTGKTPAAQLVTSAGANTGNSDLMLLLIAGMKMQPCNPTFIQARDAIIAADQAMFAGRYNCAIWNGFAKRGLGMKAASTGNPGTGTFTNDNTLPAGCAATA